MTGAPMRLTASSRCTTCGHCRAFCRAGLSAHSSAVLCSKDLWNGSAAEPPATVALALIVGIVFAVRFGTFVAHNTSVFTTFDKCIAKAGNRSAVSNCIARLANDIRP